MRYLLLFLTIRGFAAFNLTWGVPALSLDTNPPIGDTDSNAKIAIDPMGNAIAIWSRSTDRSASEDIWVSIYNHSLRVWTGALKISDGGSAENGSVAIDAKGNATVVWQEGFPTQIKMRKLSHQGVWTPDLSSPATFVAESKNGQTLPQAASDQTKTTFVVWQEFYNGLEHIHAAVEDERGTWTHFGPLSSLNHQATIVPSKALAANQEGAAIAVWQESDGFFSKIHGAIYENGVWSSNLLISEKDKKAMSPAVDFSDDQRAVVVWSQDQKIYSQILENQTLLPDPIVISDPLFQAARPDVGLDAKGNAIAVFERSNSKHKFISSAFLKKGSNTWTSPIDISGPSRVEEPFAGFPVLSVNAIGDAVVIWKEPKEEYIVIQGAGYSLGTWSNTKTLSSLTNSSGAKAPVYDLSVALNNAGNILAIWPEDSNMTGTLQIKSTAGIGLANEAPFPPLADPLTLEDGIVVGVQEIHRFPAHTDIINILTWSCSGDIDHYNVYRNSLSSLIGTTIKPYFEDHQRKPKKEEIYLITAVNQHGQESAPMTITVSPK